MNARSHVLDLGTCNVLGVKATKFGCMRRCEVDFTRLGKECVIGEVCVVIGCRSWKRQSKWVLCCCVVLGRDL